jgi:leader peptidase (prepilin peptidase)/N-methyltransferase
LTGHLVTPSLVVFDLRLRRLPNVLVVPGFGAAVIDGCWAGTSSGELPVAALATTSIVAVVMLVLNLVGGLGMGDVKLSIVMAGCLSLVSPLLAVSALMLAFFLGGGYSTVLLLSRRGQRGRRIECRRRRCRGGPGRRRRGRRGIFRSRRRE